MAGLFGFCPATIPGFVSPWRGMKTLSSLLCGAIVLLAGCASEPESHLVTAPPPPAPGTPVQTVVTTQTTQQTPNGTVTTTQTQPAGSYIITQTAPPAPQAEVILARPSAYHVWIAGYWTWRNDRYEWMAGHWEMPPQPNATWYAPHWEPENGAFRFYEGYWN